MRVFYYGVTRNFGDRMNAWLWPRLIPGQLAAPSQDVLVGIGSLIKADLGKVPGKKIVLGTGSGYGALPLEAEIAEWRIYCVRGPLTARLLGLPRESAVVDGAWLVDELPELRYDPTIERTGTVFIPHWTTDVYANWRQPCAEAGIRYVSPLEDGDAVFRAISHARLAIVESLHGAIMADYYRVPWIPVATDGRVLEYKWLDFCLSLDLPFRPIRLPVTDWFERFLASKGRPWSGGVEYLPEALESDFVEMPRAKQEPVTLRYRTAIRLKAMARPVRSSALSLVSAVRRSAPARKAFAVESHRLAALLTAIAGEPAYLSDDSIRQDRLDRLKQTLDRFRADFPQ
jgi:succinoglycan biosynthesis protein ExoV